MTSREHMLPAWTKGDGPEADVVLSTRARLARSLVHFPFPHRASREDLETVAGLVRAACAELTARFPGLRSFAVEKLSRQERSYLLDAHLASVEQISAGEGRIVVMEPGAPLAIMVNEEDHVRLQSIVSGLACGPAWSLVDWADDLLARKLEYGFSDEHGYLTASVSNVGTGLRISALVHLAGLAMTGTLAPQLRAAYDLGVSVRGLYGEGTRSLGDLFQVSNTVTLGLSEREIVQRVTTVAQYLLGEERRARKELLSAQRNRLIDSAARGLAALRSTLSIRAEEAIESLSPLRLAEALGLAEGCSLALLNELLIGMQVGSGDGGVACVERADLVRAKLAEVNIVPS